MALPQSTMTSTGWREIADFGPQGWSAEADAELRARQCCELLEKGEILFFPRPPFPLAEDDRNYLTGQRRMDSRLHKNISYRPGEDLLRGFSDGQENENRMHGIMRAYSGAVAGFVSRLLSPYAGKFQLDYASFRPLEEEGRDLPLHKRNDLLHVDAFPSRPTRGGRILRVFTNINPDTSRVWNVAERFDVLAENLAVEAGLNRIAAQDSSAFQGLLNKTMRAMRSVGIPLVDRSAYDKFMLRFHDYLKENNSYQANCAKTRLEFPPQSTW